MGEPVLCYLIIIGTVLVSLKGFSDEAFTNRLIFNPLAILGQGQWYRLVTPALLHLNLAHLALNMYMLWMFGKSIEQAFGAPTLLMIYLVSIVGGDALSLFIHRGDAHYRALGASGGVSGLVFAYVFLFPGASLGIIFIPVYFPAPLFAIVWLIIEFYFMGPNQRIGHDAHIGGAILGLLATILFYPAQALAQWWIILILLAISAFILFSVLKNYRPMSGVSLPKRKKQPEKRYAADRFQDYDEAEARMNERQEIDRILDKISAKGFESLNKYERRALEKHQRK